MAATMTLMAVTNIATHLKATAVDMVALAGEDMTATTTIQMDRVSPPTIRTVTPTVTRTALTATLSLARRIIMAAMTTATPEADMATTVAMAACARAVTRS